jgi:hypothetical protein
MKKKIDDVVAKAASRTTSRGRAAALVAAASLVLSVFVVSQAPVASALTGPINSTLPTTSQATPWKIPFLAALPSYQLTVSGANAAFSVIPSLPQGMSLTSTGILSGTPSVLTPVTTYTITATSADPLDLTVVTMPLTLTVVPTVIAPVNVSGAVGQALPAGYTIKAEGFANPLLDFNPPLPWLNVDVKGVLSGVPTAAVQQAVVVTAYESGFPVASGVTATINLSIAATGTGPITGAGLSPATQTAVGTVGIPLAPATTAFPAAASSTYTVTPDITVATGLTISSTTGQVSGTPTKPIAAGTAFTIQQRDVTSAAVLATSVLNLTVNGSLGTTQLVRVSAGSALAPVVPFGPTAAVAAGLTSPVTFSVSPALPTGLALDPSTGALSGVPAAAASGDFTVTATDGTGAKATGTLTLSVGGSLTPAIQSLTGTVGQNVTSQAMSATGMRAPVSYSIAPAAPGGMLFDSATGVLSGIPTTPVLNGIFTITATDAGGARSTASLSLTVSSGFLAVPVIGTVTGGAQAGSLQVYFATPTGATAGQSYTVEVYDSTGTTLVTSITTTSSPATVTGLVAGQTYSVIVSTGGTGGSAPVQSLPRTGTAATAESAKAFSLASSATVPFTLSGSSGTSGLSFADVGIVVGTAAKTKKATKAFATKKPNRKIIGSEKIHVPLDTFVSIVIPKISVKGQIQVQVRLVKHNWVTAGFAQADKSGQLTLPAMQSSRPGTYAIRLKPPAGNSGHYRIVFDAPSTSTTTPTSTASGKKPAPTGTQSGF